MAILSTVFIVSSIKVSKMSITLGLFLMVVPGSLFLLTAKPSVSARCEHLHHRKVTTF